MQGLEPLVPAPLKPLAGEASSRGAPGGGLESEGAASGVGPESSALLWLLPSVLTEAGEETAQSSTSSQLFDDRSIFEGLKDGLDSLLDSAFDELGNVRGAALTLSLSPAMARGLAGLVPPCWSRCIVVRVSRAPCVSHAVCVLAQKGPSRRTKAGRGVQAAHLLFTCGVPLELLLRELAPCCVYACHCSPQPWREGNVKIQQTAARGQRGPQEAAARRQTLHPLSEMGAKAVSLPCPLPPQRPQQQAQPHRKRQSQMK